MESKDGRVLEGAYTRADLRGRKRLGVVLEAACVHVRVGFYFILNINIWAYSSIRLEQLSHKQ